MAVCTAEVVVGVHAAKEGVIALKLLEWIFGMVGMLLVFFMFLVIVFKDSLTEYLYAKADELRSRAEHQRKETKHDSD